MQENQIICGDNIEVMKGWPDKKYQIIYADPPWLYEFPATRASRGGAKADYPTMGKEEICALTIVLYQKLSIARNGGIYYEQIQTILLAQKPLS